MLEVIGYVAAALVGLSLGLIGSGGSIVTVPVLVYLFNLSPLVAVSYSLFIVGITSLVGALNNVRKKQVDFRIAIFFGSSSVFTTFIIRSWVIPRIPSHIGSVGGFGISFSFLTMILLALLMLLSVRSMMRRKRSYVATDTKSKWMLLAYGVAIGIVTGFLGAGGGFLLIPVLVVLMRLDMRKAVGTSLVIIAMNTLAGFAGDIGQIKIEWGLLLTITAIAVTGILAGGWLSKFIQPSRLKTGFAWFLLLVALYVITREVITVSVSD